MPLRMDCELLNSVCLVCLSSHVNLRLSTYFDFLETPSEFVYLII